MLVIILNEVEKLMVEIAFKRKKNTWTILYVKQKSFKNSKSQDIEIKSFDPISRNILQSNFKAKLKKKIGDPSIYILMNI